MTPKTLSSKNLLFKFLPRRHHATDLVEGVWLSGAGGGGRLLADDIGWLGGRQQTGPHSVGQGGHQGGGPHLRPRAEHASWPAAHGRTQLSRHDGLAI